MSIYQKHPWIIPIAPFFILFLILHGIISYFLTMLCPIKVWTSWNRFGSKMVGWIPKEEITKEFRHAGFNCRVCKHKSGTLDGYVVLPKEHPYYGKGPWHVLVPALEGFHISTPSSGEDQWGVRFYTHMDYHTVDFVMNKTKQLAEQLAMKSREGSF